MTGKPASIDWDKPLRLKGSKRPLYKVGKFRHPVSWKTCYDLGLEDRWGATGIGFFDEYGRCVAAGDAPYGWSEVENFDPVAEPPETWLVMIEAERQQAAAALQSNPLFGAF